MGGRRYSVNFEGKQKTNSDIDQEFLQSIFDSNPKPSRPVSNSRPSSSKGLNLVFNSKPSIIQENSHDLTLPIIAASTNFRGKLERQNFGARATSSAKVFSASSHHTKYNSQSEVKLKEQRKLLQLQYQLNQGKKFSAPPKTDSISDDDFIRNCAISAISSASSSISWAEDAVEAEFTDKLSNLWDDVDKVCTGQLQEKPAKMSTGVFEECLQWKRAFPNQNLARFTKYKGGDLTPTPSSAHSRFVIASSPAVTPLSIITTNFSPPDSRLQECLTPNPLTSSEYVNSWLSECQNQDVETPTEDVILEKEQFSLPPFLLLPQVSTKPTETKTFPSNSPGSLFPVPKLRPNTSSAKPIDSFVPDPNNLFTSLTLSDTTNARAPTYFNNNDGISYESDDIPRKSPNNGHFVGNVRVQRPISSHVRGHAITPISTGLVNQGSFRKSATNRANSIPAPSASNSSSLPVFLSSYNSSGNTPHGNEGKFSAQGAQNHQVSSAFYGRSRGPGSNSASLTSNKYNPTWSRYSGSTNEPVGEYEPPYFETIAEDMSFESNIGNRPNFLPVSTDSDKISVKNSNGSFYQTKSNNNSEKQPAKPFFFWLLDRVSPN